MKHKIYYKYPENPVRASQLIDQLAPLFAAYWDEAGDDTPFVFNIVGLMTQMRLGNMALVVLYDGSDVAGFAIVSKMQSLFTEDVSVNWAHIYVRESLRGANPIRYVLANVNPELTHEWGVTRAYTTATPRLQKVHERNGAIFEAAVMRYKL